MSAACTPDHSLGRQISMTAKRTRTWADAVFAEHGASLVTWIVLRHALQAEPPGFSQRELADDMAIGGPALVPQLDRLQQAGLVERRPDPHDRRITRVSITAEGRRRHAELALVADEIDRELRSVLTNDEADLLLDALARIERHVAATHATGSGMSAVPSPTGGPTAVEPRHDEVIRTVELTKVYPGGVKAVDRLDLTVRRGEIFGLLGPNGAGKTTTAGMLTTRVVPTGGRAFVGGVDVWRHPARAKQLIGVVPQTNTLDRSLDVWENLYYHGRFFGMSGSRARHEADDMLERFKLTERARMPVLALSGGMAQRLMVARAVMHRPSVLFLDEPTAGLDPQSRIAMWEILGDLHTDGQTILLTTHYMEEADQLCDRLAVIDHGRVLALDTPENLKRSTGIDTSVTVTADGDLASLADVLEAEIEGATSAIVIEGTVRLGVRGARGVLPQVVQVADRRGITVTDLSITEPTLETVFIDLTGKDLRE